MKRGMTDDGCRLPSASVLRPQSSGTSMRGRFITFEGGRGDRQVHPCGDAGASPQGAWARRPLDPRARRLAGRGGDPPRAVVGRRQAAWPGCGGDPVRGRPRRSCEACHQAGAGSAASGWCATASPIPRASIRACSATSTRASSQGLERLDHRRPQARPHLHPRRAGGARPGAGEQAARRGSRRGPLRDRGAGVPPEAARRLPRAGGERAGPLRADRCARRPQGGRRADLGRRSARGSTRPRRRCSSRMRPREPRAERRRRADRHPTSARERFACSATPRPSRRCSKPIAAARLRMPG